MTEADKEKIKHRATFYNGLGLVFIAAVTFGVGLQFLLAGAERIGGEVDPRGLEWFYAMGRFAVFLIIGNIGGFVMHLIGQAELRKLHDQ